jgi:hypothetical protein
MKVRDWIGLAVAFVIVTFVLGGLVSGIGHYLAANQRDQCRVSNDSRGGVFDLASNAAENRRIQAARETVEGNLSAAEDSLTAASDYQRIADRQLQSVPPDERRNSGRPERDCAESFPDPLPWP